MLKITTKRSDGSVLSANELDALLCNAVCQEVDPVRFSQEYHMVCGAMVQCATDARNIECDPVTVTCDMILKQMSEWYPEITSLIIEDLVQILAGTVTTITYSI
jgi:hypothetical protein